MRSKLKGICYYARMIYLNEYLAKFPRLKASDRNGDMELNKILLNIMSNVHIKQAYVQGFEYETVDLKCCKYV